jgi:cholestenol delta-isomerase
MEESLTGGTMTQARAGAARVGRLPMRDRLIIVLLGSFLLAAGTLELFFIVHAHELPALADSSLMARLFQIYGAADRAYFDPVSPLALALETLNVFVTQIFNVWLIYAIVAHRPYRYPMQLAVASYLSYSVILYFWTNHLDGYTNMAVKDASSYWLFYAPNLPWLFGYLYMVWDASRAITERFKREP